VAVPRFSYTLMGGQEQPPAGQIWENVTLKLPPGAPSEFENVFTGERVRATDGMLFCRDAFSSFPVCILSGTAA